MFQWLVALVARAIGNRDHDREAEAERPPKVCLLLGSRGTIICLSG
jgi:hypothetical protein